MSYYSQYSSSLSSYPEFSILYQCPPPCSIFSPLSHLSFCPDCSLLCCSHCSSQSIDTYYCPSCLNSVFSSSALSQEMKCDQCVDCPHCCFPLQLIQIDNGGAVAWRCGHCEWSSHLDCFPPLFASDVSHLVAKVRESEISAIQKSESSRLTDFYKKKYHGGDLKEEIRMVTASSLILSKEQQGAKREVSTIHSFLESQKEKDEEMKNKIYLIPKDPMEIQFEEIPKHQQRDNNGKMKVNIVDGKVNDTPLTSASSSSSLPTISLSSLPGFSTLLSYPHLRSPSPSSLLPRRRALQSKLAHRCPKCLKYVIKPGPGASKCSFEIHHAAMKCFPNLEISPFSALTVGQKIPFVLFIKNPLEKEVVVRISILKGKTPEDKILERQTEREKLKNLTPITPLNPSAMAVMEGRGKDIGSEVKSINEIREKKSIGHKVIYGSATPRFKYSPTAFPSPSSSLSFYPHTCHVEIHSDWISIPPYDDISDDNFLQNPTNPTGAKSYGLKPNDNLEFLHSRQMSRVGVRGSLTILNDRWREIPIQFHLKLQLETKVPARGASGFEEYESIVRVEMGMAEESGKTEGEKKKVSAKSSIIGEIIMANQGT